MKAFKYIHKFTDFYPKFIQCKDQSFSVIENPEIFIAPIQAFCDAFLFLMVQVDFDLADNALVHADSWKILKQVDVSLDFWICWESRLGFFAAKHCGYYYDANYN